METIIIAFSFAELKQKNFLTHRKKQIYREPAAPLPSSDPLYAQFDFLKFDNVLGLSIATIM